VGEQAVCKKDSANHNHLLSWSRISGIDDDYSMDNQPGIQHINRKKMACF